MASTLDPVSGLATDVLSRYLGNVKTPKPSGDVVSRYVNNLATPSGAPAAPGDPLAGPAAPAAPATPGVQDLQSLIENDPLYKQTAADVAASRIASQGQLTAARQRALTLYGEVPDPSQENPALVGNIAPDITDTVRQLAQQSTAAGLSTTGRLKQAYDDNVDALKNSLTARGLLSSGETGYQLGKQNTTYQQSKYDALQQLLDLLAGYQSSYLTNDQSLRQQIAAAAQAAAGRIPLDTVPATPLSTLAAPASSGGSGIPALDQFFKALPGGGFAAPTTQIPIARPGALYAS